MRVPLHRSLTTWSVLGLTAGLVLGISGHAAGGSFIRGILAAVRPFGELWVNALQAIVVPLVFTHMLAATVDTGAERGGSLARIGVQSLLLFVAMLAGAALFTLALAPPLISLYRVDADVLAQIGSIAVPEAARAEATAGTAVSPGEWLGALIPNNLFQAAAAGDVLPLLLFAILLGLAVRQLPLSQREPIGRIFQGLAAAMLTVVRWILTLTPVGVFAFSLQLALEAGGAAAGLLGAFVVIQCVLMLAMTGLLYPLSALVGGVRVVSFAKAVAAAQVVAISTRSSIASLPALIQGAREHLGLPGMATGFVLPLSNSVFKLNRTVSSTAKVLFVAHIYGISLTVPTLATFVITIIVMSFTSVGVPGGGVAFRSLPVYLAAGVPLAGIIILETVDAITDVFKTLLNVTAQMSAATLLGRGSEVTGDGLTPVLEPSVAEQARLS